MQELKGSKKQCRRMSEFGDRQFVAPCACCLPAREQIPLF